MLIKKLYKIESKQVKIIFFQKKHKIEHHILNQKLLFFLHKDDSII